MRTRYTEERDRQLGHWDSDKLQSYRSATSVSHP